MSENAPEPRPPQTITPPPAAPGGEPAAASAATAPSTPRDWRKHIRPAAIVLGAAISIIILIQNSTATIFKILFWEWSAPLWLLLAIHFIAGAGVALLYENIRRKRRARPPAAK
jgi:uncharacterized integral membrane protein